MYNLNSADILEVSVVFFWAPFFLFDRKFEDPESWGGDNLVKHCMSETGGTC